MLKKKLTLAINDPSFIIININYHIYDIYIPIHFDIKNNLFIVFKTRKLYIIYIIIGN